MKKLGIGILVSALSISALMAMGHGYHKGHNYNKSYNKSIYQNITEKQKEDLVFMYQEEKMARDVYINMYKEYNQWIFDKISKSEQKHMDAIGKLLNRYGIEKPVDSNNIGQFADNDIQELYNSLIEEGNKSLDDAYKVGVAIEETDIKDLKEKMEDGNSIINRVYNNLLRGSYNHLRAFNRHI